MLGVHRTRIPVAPGGKRDRKGAQDAPHAFATSLFLRTFFAACNADMKYCGSRSLPLTILFPASSSGPLADLVNCPAFLEENLVAEYEL